MDGIKNSKKTAEIILDYRCNLNCIFCNTPSFLKNNVKTYKQIIYEMKIAKKKGVSKLILNGGEPTIRKDIFKIVFYANKIGFEKIEINTNGLMFSNTMFTEKITKAGLNSVKLSLHSHLEKIEDSLSRGKNSFILKNKAINQISKKIPNLSLISVVQNSNVDFLYDYIKFYNKKGINKFDFYFINLTKESMVEEKKLVPKISYAASKILDCYKKTKDFQLQRFMVDFIPYCFFKNNPEIVFNPKELDHLIFDMNNIIALKDCEFDFGMKVDKCKECIYYSKCMGISPYYIKLYGGNEIKPIIH